MKTWSMLVAVLVLAVGTSLAMAEGAEHKANRKGGTITKIDNANITIQPRAMGDAKPAEVTFATDDKTVVTAGTATGDAKKVSDLKVGDKILVTLTDDSATATAIILNPTGGKKGNK